MQVTVLICSLLLQFLNVIIDHLTRFDVFGIVSASDVLVSICCVAGPKQNSFSFVCHRYLINQIHSPNVPIFFFLFNFVSPCMECPQNDKCNF